MIEQFAKQHNIAGDPSEYILLEWTNNFATIAGFARYYNMEPNDALTLILMAKREVENGR